MGSLRLPGKPLADIAGVPMVVRVCRRALAAGIGRVVVAAADAEIAAVAAAHGLEAVLTDRTCRRVPIASPPPSIASTPSAIMTWRSTCRATCR